MAERTIALLGLASQTVTADGDSGDIEAWDVSSLRWDLEVTAVVGTSNNASFVLENKGADGVYYTLDAQAANTGTKFGRSIGRGFAINEQIAPMVRLRWDLPASMTSLTFSASIVGR